MAKLRTIHPSQYCYGERELRLAQSTELKVKTNVGSNFIIRSLRGEV